MRVTIACAARECSGWNMRWLRPEGALDRSALDSLTGATTELLVLTKMFLATESPKAGDESGEVWYNEYYEKQYEKVVTAVRDYMTSTQSSLAPRAEQLKKNAYRAVTPVLISLVVMIATVLMLFTLRCSTVSIRSWR